MPNSTVLAILGLRVHEFKSRAEILSSLKMTVLGHGIEGDFIPVRIFKRSKAFAKDTVVVVTDLARLGQSPFAILQSLAWLYTPHSGGNGFAWLHNHLLHGEEEIRPDSCIKGMHVVFDQESSKCSLQKFKRCDGGYNQNLELVQDLPLSACSSQMVDQELSKILSSKPGIGESKLQFGNYECIQFCDAKDGVGNHVQIKRELSFSDPACTNSDLPVEIKTIVANTETGVISQFESPTAPSASGISVNEITNCSSSLEERDSGYVH